MNKFSFLILLFVLSCGNKAIDENNEAKEAEVYYPFSPRMDIDFTMGNKNYSNIVLNIWRGYSSGNIKGYSKYFADSVKLILPEKVLEGKSGDVLAAFQERRNNLSTLQAHVEFWQPVFVKERNEQWILLWLAQEGTDHKKKLDSYSMHQVWKFNQQGKIFMMQEYRSGWNW